MGGIGFIKRVFGLPVELTRKLSGAVREIDTTKHLAAKVLVDRIRRAGIYENIHDTEFKVYSQWGDDGIIQYLINNIDIPVGSRTFIEFGVEDYTESTTRFLLMNDNWKGLVMDSSGANVACIKSDPIYWRFELTAAEAFIDSDNINGLISANGFTGEIGLLHIDIDGNDYWVWKAISVVDPIIAVVEYNSVFGKDRAVTIPYAPDFFRTKAHRSNLYFGASLKALCMLADEKGYCFVGSSSSGNNAYFVRKDKVGMVKTLTAEEGYVKSRARESRDERGRLTYVSGDERIKLIGGMDVYDIEEDRLVKIRDMAGLA